jgi:hypothetical protein
MSRSLICLCLRSNRVLCVYVCVLVCLCVFVWVCVTKAKAITSVVTWRNGRGSVLKDGSKNGGKAIQSHKGELRQFILPSKR